MHDTQKPVAELSVAELKISGMTCTACSSRLQRVLNNLPDINAQVNFATESAKINFTVSDESNYQNQINQIIEAVDDAGFSAVLQKAGEIESSVNTNNSKELWLFIGAGVFSSPLLLPMIPMILGYLGLVSDALHHQLMSSYSTQFILASIVQFGFGWRFYKSGWQALISGSANMDTLVAMGTSTAYLLSTAVWLFNINFVQLYFEASAGIITFVLLGKALEARAKKSSQAALSALITLKPATAYKLENYHVDGDNENIIETPVAELKIGDVILVRSGQSIPADGSIIKGRANINEAMLTGESLPINKTVNDEVFCATINTDGVLFVEVTKSSEHNLLAGIINMVRSAQGSKAEIQQFADKIASVFVPTVMAISALTFIGWLIAGKLGIMSFTHLSPTNINILLMAIINAAAVLVIACPCAVGLATPMAVVVAIGQAARFGILVREFSTFENLIKINRVVFDKTGTLTEGNPTLSSIQIINSSENENQILTKILALEQSSHHPLAVAIQKEVDKREITVKVADSIQNFAGLGISGKIADEQYFCGSQKFILSQNINCDGVNVNAQNALLYFANEHKLIAVASFNDPLRPNSVLAIEQWHKRGLLLAVLSGDRNEVVSAIIPKNLHKNFDEIACELMPEDKLAKIRSWQNNKEKVLMIGDGINDAPALALADISIAIGAGSETAIETAQIALLQNDLRQSVNVYDLAHASFSTIKRNLFFAFIFNLVGIPLAAFGVISPLIAGAMMAMSSVTVVSSSLLLKLWRPQKQ